MEIYHYSLIIIVNFSFLLMISNIWKVLILAIYKLEKWLCNWYRVKFTHISGICLMLDELMLNNIEVDM